MKKAYTPFGRYFFSLRKSRGDTISDASKKLGVSISYISAVEHGDRELPYDWVKKISNAYELNEEEMERLKKSFYDTPSQKKISLEEIEECMRNMFENLFEGEEKEKMLSELKCRLDSLRK